MGRFRQTIIKKLHPEGILWPGSVFYNALSKTRAFTQHYALVAHDVKKRCKTERILDIGTGPGHLLVALRQVLPAARLLGVDVSSAMVAQAEKNIRIGGYDYDIGVKCAPANALPFDDGSFDCVVSTGSLHHWKEPVQALSEVNRVLCAGGSALMYDLVTKMPMGVWKDVRRQFGGFWLALLWLHSFEEPFMSSEEMVALGERSDMVVAGTHFTGALCCLTLRKES